MPKRSGKNTHEFYKRADNKERNAAFILYKEKKYR